MCKYLFFCVHLSVDDCTGPQGKANRQSVFQWSSLRCVFPLITVVSRPLWYSTNSLRYTMFLKVFKCLRSYNTKCMLKDASYVKPNGPFNIAICQNTNTCSRDHSFLTGSCWAQGFQSVLGHRHLWSVRLIPFFLAALNQTFNKAIISCLSKSLNSEHLVSVDNCLNFTLRGELPVAVEL